MLDPVEDKLLARFLAGLCTPEEEDRVRAWLAQNGAGRLEGMVPAEGHDHAIQTILNRAAEPEKSSLRLVVSRGRMIAYAGLAAAVALLLSVSVLLNRPDRMQAPADPGEIVFATRPGEQRQVDLPDGTSVRLGVASTLSASISGSTREVALQGEAFFDVAHRPDAPFRIRANGAEVQVLGTAFGVQAYRPGGEVDVVVTRGRVSLRSARKAGVSALLTPGLQGTLVPGSGRVAVTRVDTAQALAWREGRLVYAGVPLSLVAEDIERWFGVQVTFGDRRLRQLRLDGTFERQSLPTILSTISTALDLRYEIEGRRVTIDRNAKR